MIAYSLLIACLHTQNFNVCRNALPALIQET